MNSKLNNYQRKRKITAFLINAVKFLFLAGMCYLFLFPIIYMVVSAIQNPDTANDPSIIWIPIDLSITNFKNAIEFMDYGSALLLSLLITVFGTLATLFSCALVGYGFARFDFWEKKIAFALVIILIIIPPQTTTISTFLNFRFFDFFGLLKLLKPIFGGDGYIQLTGSPFTMILPALFASGIRAGLAIYIFRQFFLGQPKALEEAAKIDGCNAFGTYFKIMLPLASPAIITVSVLSAVWYWNDSFYTTLFFNDNQRPIATALELMRSTFMESQTQAFNVFEQKGMLAAGALLCVIPPMVLYFIVQRKFTESIENTGIVG